MDCSRKEVVKMMLEKKTTEFLEELSSARPVPGGGGACAAAGALAASLGMMVANLTFGKKKYAEAEEELRGVCGRLEELRDRLVSLVDEDAEAFAPLAKAYSLPKDQREAVMEDALLGASMVPAKIMETALEAMKLLAVLEEKGSRLAVSDAGVGALFAQAALEGAAMNVWINTGLMADRRRAEELNAMTEALILEGKTVRDDICGKVLAKIR